MAGTRWNRPLCIQGLGFKLKVWSYTILYAQLYGHEPQHSMQIAGLRGHV